MRKWIQFRQKSNSCCCTGERDNGYWGVIVWNIHHSVETGEEPILMFEYTVLILLHIKVSILHIENIKHKRSQKWRFILSIQVSKDSFWNVLWDNIVSRCRCIMKECIMEENGSWKRRWAYISLPRYESTIRWQMRQYVYAQGYLPTYLYL